MRLKWWHIALLLTLLIVVISPIASTYPDGLERVSEDSGFAGKAHQSFLNIFTNYSVSGVPGEPLSTVAAGLIGIVLLFGIGIGLAYLLKDRKNEA